VFTTCPKCTLTLVVTANDLRAGQGYVRCGRCANVFNALINLTDGGGRQIAAGTPEDVPAVDERADLDVDTAPAEVLDPQIDEPQVDMPALIEPDISDAALEFHPETTSADDVFISIPDDASHISTGNFESIVLEGEDHQSLPVEPAPELIQDIFEDDSPSSVDLAALRMPVPDFELPDSMASPNVDFDTSEIAESPSPPAKPFQLEQDELEILALLERASKQEGSAEFAAEAETETIRPAAAKSESPSPAGFADSAQWAPPPVPVATSAGPRSRVAVELPDTVFPDAEAVAERFIERKVNERYARWLLIGTIALAVLLVGQFIHHSRQAIAGSGALGIPIVKLYGLFGVQLGPTYDAAAYDVRQLGAEAEPGDATRLIVRASVRNAGTRSQPLPLLRLTLQDRYGNPVATRDLRPAEYVPAASKALTMLAADQRIDTEVRVVDPGRSAVGFEIDACLANASGTLTCSNDARRRATAAAR
jgi:predicted Zn finger-like uncharacterized protein